MKKLLVLFVFALSINGCSKEDSTEEIDVVKPPEVESFSIISDVTNIKALQIVTITFPNEIVLTQTSYEVNFGEENKVILNKGEENEYVFLAPDISSGTYKLQMEIGGKVGFKDFILQEIEDVSEVNTYLETNLMTPILEEKENANLAILDPNITFEQKSYIEFGNEIFNKVQPLYDNLTIQEKQQLRKLLIANNLLPSTLGSKSSFNLSGLTQDKLKLLKYVAKIYLSIEATVALVAGTPDPVSKVVAFVTASYALYQGYEMAMFIGEMADKYSIPYLNKLEDVSYKTSKSKASKVTSTFEFENGIPKTFKVVSLGRKFQKSDINHSNENIATAVAAMSDSYSGLNKFKKSMDELISKIGSFIGVSENKIVEYAGLPEVGDEVILTDTDYTKFSITNLPSDVSSMLSSPDNVILNVTLSSTGNLPTIINANLNYKDEVFETNSGFEAKIVQNTKIELSGDLYFGDVTVNSMVEKVLTITNNFKEELEITSLEFLPHTDNFLLSSPRSGTIQAGGTLDIKVRFIPDAVKEFKGEIIIHNNKDQKNNKKEYLGRGSYGLTLENGHTEINFGEVSKNTSKNYQLKIENNTSEAVSISGLKFTPAGDFTTDWKGGTLDAGAIINVPISFTPTAEQDYTTTLEVVNDKDQKNNKITLLGKGIKNDGLIITGDLNFGEVKVNETLTKQITFKNSSKGTIVVNSLVGLESNFSSSFNPNTELAPETSMQVNITYTPVKISESSEKPTYNITFKTSIGDFTKEIKRKAVGSNSISLSGDLDFGQVIVGETSNNGRLIITNNYQEPITVSLKSYPTGFTPINAIQTSMEPYSTQEVFFSFTPSAKQSYNGFIYVNSSIGNESIAIKGEGIEESNNFAELILGTWILDTDTVECGGLSLDFSSSLNATYDYDVDDCDRVETYEISGTTLLLTADGQTRSSEIIELTASSLKLVGNGATYIYSRIVDERLIGSWVLYEQDGEQVTYGKETIFYYYDCPNTKIDAKQKNDRFYFTFSPDNKLTIDVKYSYLSYGYPVSNQHCDASGAIIGEWKLYEEISSTMYVIINSNTINIEYLDGEYESENFKFELTDNTFKLIIDDDEVYLFKRKL